MNFSNDQLDTLRKMLNGINVTDDMLSRGVRLTQNGTEKVAKRFRISTADVPAMITATADRTKQDISESGERFSYEADYMGNITLRDSQTGKDVYLQGDDAFALGDELEKNPDEQDSLIAPYFDKDILDEDVGEDDVPAIAQHGAGTFNFPYRGKFATARYWVDSKKGFQLKVISLMDAEDNETEITPELQGTLDAIAMKWVDKV